MATTKTVTLEFDDDVLALIQQQATLAGITPTEFMRKAILAKLADKLDYQAAVRNLRESHGTTASRNEVKRMLGL